MKNLTTKMMTLCGLFAALTAVFSQIAFDIGPVPINLATLSVFMAGAFLGSKYGTVSQLVYVLLGAIGVPVFAHFTGGFSIIIGPTGGYIVGYIAAAFVTGILTEKIKGNRYIVFPLAMITGLIVCYALGTAWFMYITNSTLLKSLTACVFPFIIGDMIKIAVAAVLVARLKKIVRL